MILLILFCIPLLWFTFQFLYHRATKLRLASIPGPRSKGFIMGNLGQLYAPTASNFLAEIDDGYPPVTRLHGFLGDTQLYINDVHAISQMLAQVEIFAPTDMYVQGNGLVFGKGLLSTVGPRHKRQRKMVVTSFSPSSLRELHPIICRVVQTLHELLLLETKNGICELDILHWSTKAALEIIGQAGLGYSFDAYSFKRGEDHPYSQAIHNLVPEIFSLFTIRQALTIFIDYIPSSVSSFVLKYTPWPKVQRIRRLVEIMDTATWEVYSARLKDITEGGDKESKDLLSVFMRANQRASPAEKLSEKEILGQISTLIFTSTDTAGGGIACALERLAHHPTAQERLRAEIVDLKQRGGTLDYDTLMTLPFLDAVCRETLRLNTPVPFLTRTTKQDAVLTLSKPLTLRDGQEISSLFIPNNTNIVASLRTVNRNTTIWGDDAEEWKPERWFNLPETVLAAKIPGSYTNLMTFSGGIKGCIGYRFLELEMKTILAMLVPSFNFSPSDQRVEWYMKGLQKPCLDVTGSPTLPLRVARL